MKLQSLFSEENWKKYFKMSSAVILLRVLSVNYFNKTMPSNTFSDVFFLFKTNHHCTFSSCFSFRCFLLLKNILNAYDGVDLGFL